MAATQQPLDPLLGYRNPPGVPMPTSAAPAPGVSSSAEIHRQGPAPLGAPMSSNPATLAAASSQGSFGQPLRIDNANPGQLTSTSKAPFADPLPPNMNPRVERVPDVSQAAVQGAGWQSGLQTAVNSAPRGDAETLFQQLQQRGVMQQKQEPAPEGIRLTCYARNPDGSVRILEVVASDYATAARAILRQLGATP